jgi:ubiquinol-cytochrome c reductase subunit 6
MALSSFFSEFFSTLHADAPEEKESPEPAQEEPQEEEPKEEEADAAEEEEEEPEDVRAIVCVR